MNRRIDLQYKQGLERELRDVLADKNYTEEQLIEILGLETKQACKAFRQVTKGRKGMTKEDIIFRLLGGRYYL